MKEKPERDLRRDLRRKCDHLACSGTGICLFGIWSILKFVMDLIQDRKSFPISPDLPVWVSYLILTILVLLFIGIIILWYLFIGLSARSVALKGKKHILYAIVAAVSVVIIILNDVTRTLDFKQSFETVDVFIVAIIIDFSLVLALIEIVISNAMVIRLRRLIQQQEAAAHES